MDTDRISHHIEIKAPIERVWDALTVPAELAEWFGTGGSVTRDGGVIEFRWAEHGRYLAHILQEEVPSHFEWRWSLTPDVEPAAGNSTTVEFRLTADGGSTRLRVTESGFTGLDMTDGEKGAVVNDNLAGWVGGFLGLKQYLEGYEESALPDDPPEQPV